MSFHVGFVKREDSITVLSSYEGVETEQNYPREVCYEKSAEKAFNLAAKKFGAQVEHVQSDDGAEVAQAFKFSLKAETGEMVRFLGALRVIFPEDKDIRDAFQELKQKKIASLPKLTISQ